MNKTNTWTIIASSILAFFEPISGNIFSLGVVFVLNLVIGMATACISLGEPFEIRKAMRCVVEAAIFFALCASIYACGKMNGNEQGAINTVSLFVYVILFIYSRNVFKNLRRALKEGTPAWMVVDFIYTVLSFEFIKGIPGLTKYIKMKEHETETETNREKA